MSVLPGGDETMLHSMKNGHIQHPGVDMLTYDNQFEQVCKSIHCISIAVLLGCVMLKVSLLGYREYYESMHRTLKDLSLKTSRKF